MSSQTKTLLTPEEYLEIERKAERKSEYYQGQMFSMAGASPRHTWIVVNAASELRQQLKGKPCRISSSDLRVRITPTGLYTYPDIVVVCGTPQYADDQKDTLLNPTVIIEVLSDSTRDYDLGRKFGHYRTLPSLAEYVTLEQNEPHVERRTRQPGGDWQLTEYRELSQVVPLASIGCELKLSEIYDKIDLEAT